MEGNRVGPSNQPPGLTDRASAGFYVRGFSTADRATQVRAAPAVVGRQMPRSRFQITGGSCGQRPKFENGVRALGTTPTALSLLCPLIPPSNIMMGSTPDGVCGRQQISSSLKTG